MIKLKREKMDIKSTFVLTLLALFLIGLAMWGIPQYSVWQQELSGKAELARAEQNRQIAIREAMAAQESAEYLAKAEVARAKGVAEANKIIADGLGGPDGYLRYLYINALQKVDEAGGTVVYIPTEAGLPILEAKRLEN